MRQIYEGDAVQRRRLATLMSRSNQREEDLLAEESGWERLSVSIAAPDDTEEEALSYVLKGDIGAHLEELPYRLRRMLQLRYAEGYSLSQVAARFGVSSGRIWQMEKQAQTKLLDRRAFRRLRDFLHR